MIYASPAALATRTIKKLNKQSFDIKCRRSSMENAHLDKNEHFNVCSDKNIFYRAITSDRFINYYFSLFSMHEFLNEEYWEVEFLADDTDKFKFDLEALAKDHNISEHELKNRFPYLYFKKDGTLLDESMNGCVWIKYTNKVATDSYDIEMLFEEHRHGSVVEVEVMVKDLKKNIVKESSKKIFDDADCKNIAATYVENKAKYLEALLKP